MNNNITFSKRNNMTTFNRVHRLTLALVAVAGITITGCGEAIDINRVGPNVVDKKLFDGEWYFRTTVVDKQFPNDMVFIGLEGGLERVRWEVTADTLIAHRSYEKVPGTDPSNPGDQNVLAMFPIEKHFDIRRGYNPTNGVETNIIEENDYDRSWWDREFMRVNWAKNLAATYDLSSLGPSGVNRNANNDPSYPWKVRVGADYIETTIDALMDPDPYVCRFLDPLSIEQSAGCTATLVKMKLSFSKVPTENDYVPLNYPDFTKPAVGELTRADDGNPVFASTLTTAGELVPRLCTTDEVNAQGQGTFLVIEEEDGDNTITRMCNTDPILGDDPTDCKEIQGECNGAEEIWFASGPEDVGITCDPSIHDPDDCFQFTIPVFQRFGFFRTDRFFTDRENGNTLTGRERLINRWNVWQKSHDADGNVLPAASREPKKIVYYMNVGFPQDLVDAVKTLEADWDTGFRSMVASAQGKHLNEISQQMLELRQNDCNIENVKRFAEENGFEDNLRNNRIDEVGYGNLENACAVLEDASQKIHAVDANAPVFTWQQLGDLRYSFLNWSSKPELAGPLGYGPSAADPITGEIISANANIYGASLDTYANWGADIVQLINGELTQGDIINGTQVREHVEAVRNRWTERLPESQVTGFRKLFDNRTRYMDDDQYYSSKPVTAVNANLDLMAAKGIEDQYMVTDEMVRMFGRDFDAQREGRVSDQMLTQARPSSWLRTTIPQEALANPASDNDKAMTPSDPLSLGMAGKVDELADYLGRQNFCYLAQQTEPAIADLAAQLAAEGLTREQVVQTIRARVFIAVTAHELGHTFGLRHNFEGSADPMNFFPEFWGVGREGLSPDQQHLGSKSPNRSEIQYSSIMDYHQRFNSDFAGIGAYDKAALKFGYAETVEIFDEDFDAGNFVARDWIDSLGILDPYTLPYLVGGGTDNVTGGSTADERINGALTGVQVDYNAGQEDAQLDITTAGITPNAANIYKRRDIPVREWLKNETLRRAYVGGYDNLAGLQNSGLLDDDGRLPKVAVPYSFCPDAYAWGGNLTCNRYDMGITSKEIVTNAGQMYEFYYPFDGFRRERVMNFYSWPQSYMNRLFSRTYQPMLNSFRYFYYYRRGGTRVFPAIRDWSEAALIGMNFFTRVLQTPDTGTYCKNGPSIDGTPDSAYVPQDAVTTACNSPVELGLGQGRMFNSTWDNEYDFRPVNIGNYWDKVLAIQSITDSNAFFFRDFSSLTNRGAFSIGYYRVFQPEVLKLFGGLMSGDASVITPRIGEDPENPGQLKVLYQPFLNVDTYGEPIAVDPALLAGDEIQPGQSFNMRRWATYLGMINLSSTLDQTMDFASRARIAIAGSASDPIHDPTILDPANIVDFTDPESGIIYRSAAIDGDASVGFNLLQEAKDFAEGPLADAEAALVTAEAGVDEVAIASARRAVLVKRAQLNEKVQIIDFVVSIGNAFEYPG